MTLKVIPWDRSFEEACQIFELMHIGYPLITPMSDEESIIVFKKVIEGFEDSVYCAHTDQGIVGYIAVMHNQARQPTLTCSVLPEMRSRGIASALFERVVKDIRGGQHKVLNSSIFASSQAAVRFLEKRGFQAVDHVFWTSRPLSTSWPEWAIKRAHAAQQDELRVIDGIELELLRSDWAEAWWRLHTEVLRDVPSAVPFSETPFDEWRTYIDPPFTQRDHVFFAVVDRELVGSLRLGELRNGKMNINHSGVASDYRRRGISTLLKYKAFEFARTQGAEYITTQNHKNNPMLALNIKLGFLVQDEAIEYAQALD